MVVRRRRKSPFVKLFTKTPKGVVCPHFYELVLSNGCPFNCSYCYLKLTFRGESHPTLFTNPWREVQRELDTLRLDGVCVFATGELADSLAITPPLLKDALVYFTQKNDRYLLLLTKSVNTNILKKREPSNQIIVSFSVNSEPSARRFEKGVPSPLKRLEAAKELKEKGWRVRIRLDPIILDTGLGGYRKIAQGIAALKPEMVTLGSLRQYPMLYAFQPNAPRAELEKSWDGRMRYPVKTRVKVYSQIAEWLGFQPSLCKETVEVWKELSWKFDGCNCTGENDRPKKMQRM